MAREFKGTMKEILGTANSLGCTVDDEEPTYLRIVYIHFIIPPCHFYRRTFIHQTKKNLTIHYRRNIGAVSFLLTNVSSKKLPFCQKKVTKSKKFIGESISKFHNIN